jgi:hypothetical protein
VPDEVCDQFKGLGDYDYRPAREMADADESTEVRPVIDVDRQALSAHHFCHSVGAPS